MPRVDRIQKLAAGPTDPQIPHQEGEASGMEPELSGKRRSLIPYEIMPHHNDSSWLGSTLGDGDDGLSTPGAASRWDAKTPNILYTESDDGNESSYGRGTWKFNPDGTVEPLEDWGRDTHDGGLLDHIMRAAPGKLSRDQEGKVEGKLSVDEFLPHYHNWWKRWQRRSGPPRQSWDEEGQEGENEP